MNKDLIAIVRFQGPKSNGMPELHKMTPYLGILQDKGYKVALVTDGRMSGASGKVPAAIHLSPEAISGGEIAKIKDGDILELDAESGELNHHVDSNTWDKRELATKNSMNSEYGTGRELFKFMRGQVESAESGASVFQLWND